MAWYNSSWLKRKAITLTGGASGAQTDYQVKLTVTYDSDMQVDFDDLRFTKSDGITLLDAWLESKVNSTSAIVWVETDTPANTIESDIYMYYGNSGASSDWSGTNTFLQYHGIASSNFLDALSITPSNIVYETNCRITNSSHNVRFGMANNADHGIDDTMGISPVSSGSIIYGYVRNEGTITYKSKSPTFVTNTYYKLKIVHTGSAVTTFVDGSQIGTGDITTNLPNENLGLSIQLVSGTGDQKWSFARKYAANPATYAFGSEEDAPSVGSTMWYYALLMRRNR